MQEVEGHTRGSKLFVSETGYIFNRSKDTTTKQYYICNDRECPATVVGDGSTLKLGREHNHIPQHQQIDKLRFDQMLREQAANTTKPFQEIFTDARVAHPHGALLAGCLHDCAPLMKSARRARTPKVPKNLIELDEALNDPK